MSSLVSYDVSSDEEDFNLEQDNASLENLFDSSSVVADNNDMVRSTSNQSLTEDASDSLNNDFKDCIPQENSENLQNSSTIINIEETSNVDCLDIEHEIIDDVMDTNPSQPQSVKEAYREHEVINISFDSKDDSSSSLSSLSDSDEDSSISSDGDPKDILSGVSDESSDSEIEKVSKIEVSNVKQKDSENCKLCSYCLKLKNKAVTTNNNASESTSSSIISNIQKDIDGKSLLECPDNNLSTCNINNEEVNNLNDSISNTEENTNSDSSFSSREEDKNLDTYDSNKEKNVLKISSRNEVNSNLDKENNESMGEKIHSQNNNCKGDNHKDIEILEDEDSEVNSNENIPKNDDSVGMFCTCPKNNKETLNINKKPKQKKKEPSYYDGDLPPIENLHISVPEEEAKLIGTVLHTVDNLVVVKTLPGIQAINLDSVLFLDQGKRALGRVDDVFGSIYQPHYVVRFKSPQDIKEKGIEKDVKVYFAPQTEHTTFVIIDNLIDAKGSDASWKDNREPPEHCLDYSDDGEERQAKQALKMKKKQQNKGNDEVTIVKEFASQRKKVRNDRTNYFSSTSPSGVLSRHNRFASPSQYSTAARNRLQRKTSNNTYSSETISKNTIRFGGPPNLRSGLESPFNPCTSIPYMNGNSSLNSYVCPSPSSSNFGLSGCGSSPPPTFSSVGRLPTPLSSPSPSFPFSNGQAFSPVLNTPPPRLPVSPMFLGQENSRTRLPATIPNNFSTNKFSHNTLIPPESWSENSQNYTSHAQNSVNTFESQNLPLSNRHNFQEPRNYSFHNIRSNFVPNNHNIPPLNSPRQMNRPPGVLSSHVNLPSVIPSMNNPPPSVPHHNVCNIPPPGMSPSLHNPPPCLPPHAPPHPPHASLSMNMPPPPRSPHESFRTFPDNPPRIPPPQFPYDVPQNY